MNLSIMPKVRSLMLVTLLLIAVAVAPVAADQSTSACSGNNLSQTGAKPVSTIISGPMADTFTSQALQNKNLLDFQAKMEKEGFVKKDATVYSVVVSKTQANATSSTGIGGVSANPLRQSTSDEYYVVGIRYESATGQNEYLHYIVNKKTGETLVVQGSFDCVTCLFELGGAGATCFAICTTLGGFTGGVACGACIGLAPLYVACPCWSCGCQLGQQFMCVAHNLKC